MARQPVHLVDGSTSAAFERLARTPVTGVPVDALLQQVVDLPRSVLPGPLDVSVTALGPDGPRTAAATGPVAETLDTAQFVGGDGPCLRAAREGAVVSVPDVHEDPGWAPFARMATACGRPSVLSVPMTVGREVPASLNLYADGPRLLAAAEVQDWVLRFAGAASVVLGNLRVHAAVRDQVGHLQTAMLSRAVIEQAKGILMERFRLTDEQAFQRLTAASMSSNRKVREVAEQLVRTGEWRGSTS